MSRRAFSSFSAPNFFFGGSYVQTTSATREQHRSECLPVGEEEQHHSPEAPGLGTEGLPGQDLSATWRDDLLH
jgi:hypothetical protein